MDLSKVKVVNIMADGTVCENEDELRAYFRRKKVELPDLTKRLVLDMIRLGQQVSESQGREGAAGAADGPAPAKEVRA